MTSMYDFGPETQNTQQGKPLPRRVNKAVSISRVRAKQKSFIQDLEIAACREINASGWIFTKHTKQKCPRAPHNAKQHKLDLTPHDLYRKDTQIKPVSLARHAVWYFVRNHPLTREDYNLAAIGRLYGRDRSSVLYGVQTRAMDSLARRPMDRLSRLIRAIDEELQRIGYAPLEGRG